MLNNSFVNLKVEESFNKRQRLLINLEQICEEVVT